MAPTDPPVVDAATAYQALRSLAHSTTQFENPADTYPVTGELLGGVRALEQVMRHVATAHTVHEGQASTDRGDAADGLQAAQLAAVELRAAAALLGQAEACLDAASQHSGRIAWQPATPKHLAAPRWVNIVFFEGHEADRLLNLLDRDGSDAVITELTGYDFGEETTQAALVNGYIYDEVPTGALDRVVTRDDYTLTYNYDLGHVSLHRAHHPAEPEPERVAAPQPPVQRASRARDIEDADDWFAPAPAPLSTRVGRSL
ncbi:hypothetical protein [Leucobacter chromiireducens]|uniref:hypothetical protein n=1 Tax=Leucobacter chromiireducens TaxID=283877 RepID=UPI001925A58E|nr:hypothetical protein [Leucobacter chromiireducens]